MQEVDHIATRPDSCQVPSPEPVLPLEQRQPIKALDLPPRWQPQAIGSTNGLLKHPLTQGIPVPARLKIQRAEELCSPGIRRRQTHLALHLPQNRMRGKGQGAEELQPADRPAEAV